MDREMNIPGVGRVLHDTAELEQPGPELFDETQWPQRRTLKGGRGEVYLVDAGERAWLIKPYLRGGLIRRLFSKSYLFLGYGQTRMFREFRLLRYLTSHDVPVPRPIAALVKRSGMRYEGSIIIERFDEVRSLSDLLRDGPLSAGQWRAVGAVIARLHNQQVNHKDLNASNILLGEGAIHIIDFDRCALQRFGVERYCRGNLSRLERSLSKSAAAGGAFGPEDWQILLQGYHDQRQEAV
jgi:tRNA A-37 threonylcarbamoyl transferase component Bud32